MKKQQHLVEVFLASALHEAKNQIGALRISVMDALESAHIVPTTSQSTRIDHQLDTISRLLSQVLMQYRCSQHNYHIHTDEVYLEDFFEELIERLTPSLSAMDARLVLEGQAFTPVFIDEQLMNNVMDTLIWNAVNAGARSIHLSCDSNKLSTSNATPYVQIHIDDDGPGFPPHLLEQPLDEFKPSDARESKTGLGLYFANSILAAHRHKNHSGYITLANHTETPGARVTLFIP